MNLKFLPNTEMGNLIREKAWDETSLGSMEFWSDNLYNSLSIMMNSRFPMFLFWGEELISFYNDAYRPSFGNHGMHPSILGKPAEEAWADIWHIVKKFPEQVLTTGIPTWEENQLIPIYRNGKIEDVYWTFSHSPIFNKAGHIEGIFVLCMDTTQQVLTAKKITESEERFRTMAESSTALIAVADESSQAAYFNKAWIDLTGRPLEDLLKIGWVDLVHPNDKDQFLGGYLSAFEKRETYSSEVRMMNKEGTYSWLLINATPRYYTDNSFAGYISSGTNITEQILARKKIEESEELFSTFGNNIQNLAWIAEGNGNIFWYNQRWIDYTGLTLEEMKGWGWQKVHHPDHVERIIEISKKLWVTNEPFELTFPLRRFDGEYRWFLTRGVPIVDEKGKIARWIGTNTDIHEQKVFESDINYRKALLEAHNEASVDGVLLVDTKGKIISYNKRFIEIWNMPQDIVSAKNDEAALAFAMTQLVNPLQFIEKVKYLYEHPTETSTDLLEYKDGKIIERNGYPVVANDGTYYAWCWTFRDITEQQTATRRIKESEQRFRTVADSAPVLIWVSGTDAIYSFFNKAWLDFTGRSLKQELENGWAEGIHPNDYKHYHDNYVESFEKREPFYIEFRLKRHDGEYRWLSDNGVPRFSSGGVFEGFIGASADIHERKMMDDSLRQREEKFRLLADSMPQLVWTSNEKGEMNYFNQTVYNYSGLSEEDIAQGGWLQIVHPEERQENIRQWIHSIDTGEIFHFEHRFKRHDGEYKWQLSRAIPQRNAEGKIQMWVGTSTEIQQQKEITKQLEQSVIRRTQELLTANNALEEKNAELEKMNGELESFTYISSHDLQEPLRKIQTFSNRILQKENQNLSPSGKDYFRRMQASAGRMQNLIEDLLAFSRTSTAERKFEMTDLNIIVDEVQSELKELIDEKQAVIESSALCELNIIPFQFRQMLHNLISNAIKFTKKDCIPHIVIDSKMINTIDSGTLNSLLPIKTRMVKKDYCHITVKDNGIGFDPQYSNLIFEVFQRLHANNDFAGTGIGLAIVKKIIENHNGFIVATGEEGKGATFNIFIPIN